MDTPMTAQGDDQANAGATPGPATPPPADAGMPSTSPTPPADAPADAPAAPPPPPTAEPTDAPTTPPPAPEVSDEPIVGGAATDNGPDSVEAMPEKAEAPTDDTAAPAA